MIIYLVTNRVTGKQYVGQTVQPIKRRWCMHGKDNYHLANSIKKHGKKNFKIEVLEKCSSREELSKREIYWIKKLDTKNPSGYNLTEGGEGVLGWKHSAKTRKKISESLKGCKGYWEGRKLSAEHCRKLSKVRKGRKFSAEHCKKMSEVRKGRKLSTEHKRGISKARKGMKFSAEHCKKMSEVRKGHKHSEETVRKISAAQKKRWSKINATS